MYDLESSTAIQLSVCTMAEKKVPITIVYQAPQTQPPLFVAGSFSNPQWVPQEMDYTTDEDGKITFSKKFDVEPDSKIQYKFRVGPGDWWVLDESAPTGILLDTTVFLPLANDTQ